MDKKTILKKLVNESVNSILSELNLHTVDNAYNKAEYNKYDYDALTRFVNNCDDVLEILNRLYGKDPSSEGYKLGQELEDLASRISDFGERKLRQIDNIYKGRDTRYEKEFGKNFKDMSQEIEDIYTNHSDDDELMADTPEWKDKYMTPNQRRFNDEHYDA